MLSAPPMDEKQIELLVDKVILNWKNKHPSTVPPTREQVKKHIRDLQPKHYESQVFSKGILSDLQVYQDFLICSVIYFNDRETDRNAPRGIVFLNKNDLTEIAAILKSNHTDIRSIKLLKNDRLAIVQGFNAGPYGNSSVPLILSVWDIPQILKTKDKTRPLLKATYDLFVNISHLTPLPNGGLALTVKKDEDQSDNEAEMDIRYKTELRNSVTVCDDKKSCYPRVDIWNAELSHRIEWKVSAEKLLISGDTLIAIGESTKKLPNTKNSKKNYFLDSLPDTIHFTLWDLKNNKPFDRAITHTFDKPFIFRNAIAFSDRHVGLLLCDEGDSYKKNRLVIWDLNSGTVKLIIKFTPPVESLCVLTDGNFVTINKKGLIQFWHSQSGKCLANIQLQNAGVCHEIINSDFQLNTIAAFREVIQFTPPKAYLDYTKECLNLAVKSIIQHSSATPNTKIDEIPNILGNYLGFSPEKKVSVSSSSSSSFSSSSTLSYIPQNSFFAGSSRTKHAHKKNHPAPVVSEEGHNNKNKKAKK